MLDVYEKDAGIYDNKIENLNLKNVAQKSFYMVKVMIMMKTKEEIIADIPLPAKVFSSSF